MFSDFQLGRNIARDTLCTVQYSTDNITVTQQSTWRRVKSDSCDLGGFHSILVNSVSSVKENSLQYRRIFGKRTLSTSSRNLKAEEGLAFPYPPPPCPLLPKSNDDGSANYRQFITLTCAP